MRKPLKIACIGARGVPSNYSGIEKVCEGLYTTLAERGHDITVYCRPQYARDSLPIYRGIHLRVSPAVRTKSLDTLSHVGTSLFHAIARENYDIIHLHALAPGVFARLCHACRVRTVFTVHGLDWQRAKWKGAGANMLRFAEASMVRNADQILVVSRDLQRYYADRYGRETIYIPNGVEPTTEANCANHEVLQEFDLISRGYVLYLGRLVPEKRVEDLIIAYRGIQSNCKLVIAGESGFTNSYVAGLRRFASGDTRIIFTGLQAGPAVYGLLHHAGVFVLPSTMEGLPMSLLECMQHGTPAVVSDIPPHRELLGGIAGYNLFFPPGNVKALRAQIEIALSAQAKYRNIAEEARVFVSRVHSWPSIAERTEAAFYGVLDQFAGCRTQVKSSTSASHLQGETAEGQQSTHGSL